MLRQFILFSLISCFLVANGYSQIGDVINTRISSERIKRSAKETHFNTKSLAKQITKYSRTDFEKAQALFIWIAGNIEYDNELRTNPTLQKSIYTSEKNVLKNVLERKKALCGGYAFLFKELCTQVGIDSKVVHGFSKKYYESSKKKKQIDHTWNAVKLNGKWCLLDITLARSQRKNNKPNLYWFNTDPRYFIKTHYPENIKWTLMTNPISRKEFERIPSK